MTLVGSWYDEQQDFKTDSIVVLIRILLVAFFIPSALPVVVDLPHLSHKKRGLE